MKFTVGQIIEYGYPRDATVGGHWFACRIVALDLGRPLIVQVKNGRGEWMDPIRVTLLRTGAKFRLVPANPWVIRSRRAGRYPSGRERYSYFVQLTWAQQNGSFSEAYRFATEREARAALKQIGGDMIAMPSDMAQRDEDGLEVRA